MKMVTLVYVILGIGFSIVGSIMFIVAAFRTSITWGVCVLLVPGAALIFLIIHWNVAWKGVTISSLAWITYASGVIVAATLD